MKVFQSSEENGCVCIVGQTVNSPGSKITIKCLNPTWKSEFFNNHNYNMCQL